MKVFFAAVVTLLASSWAADPPNVEVKEVNNKCVWTMRTAKPATGCPVTFPNKAALEKIGKDATELTAGLKKLGDDLKRDVYTKLNNHNTQALMERDEIDLEVKQLTQAIKNIEDSNTALTQKITSIAGEIRTMDGKVKALDAQIKKLLP